MHVIRHTTATIESATAPYALRGIELFSGTLTKLFDGAGRDVMGLPGPGRFMLKGSPLQIVGLGSGGGLTDLYIYVE